MKKAIPVVFVILLVAAFSIGAFASNSVDFTNSGGTLMGSNAGMMLMGSTLIAVNGLNGLITGNDLGTLTLSTGALLGGNLQMGAVFGPPEPRLGGSFVITGNGTGGIPNGVIFNGTFHGPATWTLITLANGTHNYTLSGDVTGTWYNGSTVFGATIQLTINTGKGFFNGATTISSDTNVAMVPEPGSLTLLGTGLVGLGGILRCKLKAQ